MRSRDFREALCGCPIPLVGRDSHIVGGVLAGEASSRMFPKFFASDLVPALERSLKRSQIGFNIFHQTSRIHQYRMVGGLDLQRDDMHGLFASFLQTN
jgi:hypothetical protein